MCEYVGTWVNAWTVRCIPSLLSYVHIDHTHALTHILKTHTHLNTHRWKWQRFLLLPLARCVTYPIYALGWLLSWTLLLPLRLLLGWW